MSDLIVLHGCATIQLTQGYNTLVDADDWPELSKRKWQMIGCKDYAYGGRNTYVRGHGTRRVLIHRAIADAPPGMVTDHINGDTLDNRRSNLRACSHGENLRNSRKHRRGQASRFKGVHWDKVNRCWKAKIYRNGRSHHLGYFKVEEEAALAYNEAARRMDGEFARLNDVVAPLMYHI